MSTPPNASKAFSKKEFTIEANGASNKKMKKLFLASVACITLDKLAELLPDEPKKLTVAFIPTAANLYTEKSWLDKDRDKLIEMGFAVKDLDIENKTKDYLEKELENIDVIFVSGGNTFYLLEKVKQSRFDEVVKRLIDKGVVYIGSSAGAVLVSPTIAAVNGLDDPADAPMLTSYESLNIVPFLVMPHYHDPEYQDIYEKIINEWSDKDYEFKLLTNTQALIVTDDEVKLVEA